MECEIHLRKKEVTFTPQGIALDQVTNLRVYSHIRSDLGLLKEFPNVNSLTLIGNFSEVDSLRSVKQLSRLMVQADAPIDFSKLNGITLRSLTVGGHVDASVSVLLSDSLQYLELYNDRRLADLSFIEIAAGLQKLYLHSLPAVQSLPDFRNLQNLYALKLYELHKLQQIESLTASAIQYFACTLTADLVSGTKIADVLLSMNDLKQAGVRLLDRSGVKRYDVIRRRLEKAGKANLLSENIQDYNTWMRL